MKRFRELIIPCSEKEAQILFPKFTLTVINFNGKKWEIHKKEIGRLFNEDKLFLYVNRLDENNTPDAMVAVVFSEYDNMESKIWVSNIVPCKTSMLSYSQYNDILTEFHADVIKPSILKPFRCILTNDSFTGEECMGSESWKLLVSFSALANRTSLHVSDNQRWRNFVTSIHRQETKLDSDTLQRTLIEELGWLEDKASVLAIRYEDELELLRQYDETRITDFESSLMSNISKTLKTEREKRGLSRKQMADLLNIKQNIYSRYENGTTLPSIEFIYRVCTKFFISSVRLFGI